MRRWKARWVFGNSGCGWPVSLLTKGVRGEDMKLRVGSKSGWYLRFLEGVGGGGLDCGVGEGEEDGGDVVDEVEELDGVFLEVSVGEGDDDSELDES